MAASAFFRRFSVIVLLAGCSHTQGFMDRHPSSEDPCSEAANEILRNIRGKSWKTRIRQAAKWGIGGSVAAAGVYYAAETAASDSPSVDSFDYPNLRNPIDPTGDPLRVALIGDSLSKNFHMDTTLKTIWILRTVNQNDFFIDTRPEVLPSVFEYLAQQKHTLAHEYSRPGSVVVSRSPRSSAEKLIARMKDFNEQANDVLEEKEFPDLLYIWIGHNNIDWITESRALSMNQAETFAEIRRVFAPAYRVQLQKLVDRAILKSKPSVLMAMGLVNFGAFFQARQAVELRRKQHPETYPFLELDLKTFPSMGLESRQGMIDLALRINDDIKQIVDEMNRGLTHSEQVKLRYSEALSKVDLSDPETLNKTDGWHPSILGHTRLAEGAISAIQDLLEHLGLR
jgi:lysophospholipase L1-like esterase